MVVMALEHTRDFVCNIRFEPEDTDHTWGFYFLVRWVAHFCAPAFFHLLHLYVIHPAAIVFGFATHQPVRWLFHGGFFLNCPPDGPPYGHGLGVVCAMWIGLVLLL
jgi:hypothetical protein